MALTIKSNYVPRDVIQSYELTDKERKEFDYIDFEDENCSATFFRFKGNVYDLGEFMRVDENSDELSGWHGYSSDSYFSGVVVRYVNDNESVIVGTYYS